MSETAIIITTYGAGAIAASVVLYYQYALISHHRVP